MQLKSLDKDQMEGKSYIKVVAVKKLVIGFRDGSVARYVTDHAVRTRKDRVCSLPSVLRICDLQIRGIGLWFCFVCFWNRSND